MERRKVIGSSRILGPACTAAKASELQRQLRAVFPGTANPPLLLLSLGAQSLKLWRLLLLLFWQWQRPAKVLLPLPLLLQQLHRPLLSLLQACQEALLPPLRLLQLPLNTCAAKRIAAAAIISLLLACIEFTMPSAPVNLLPPRAASCPHLLRLLP